MKKILFPTDGSKTANAALDFAIDIAKQEKGRIMVVFVADTTTDAYKAKKALIKAAGKKILEETEKKLEKKRIKVQTKLLEGNPKKEIVKAAKKLKADMIIMGTHGIGVLERTILGSVADAVVRSCHCPVVLVPHV